MEKKTLAIAAMMVLGGRALAQNNQDDNQNNNLNASVEKLMDQKKQLKLKRKH